MSDVTEMDCYPPWNFSWVIKNELALMGWPQTSANINYIIKEGIKYLITLSSEKLPAISTSTELEWNLIPVNEFEAPKIEQIIKFIDICNMCRQNNKAIGVHCRMGRGRSGVMAACYYLQFQQMAPERAITTLRLQRPGSVETKEQERAVIRYHDYIRGTSLFDIQKIENELQRYQN